MQSGHRGKDSPFLFMFTEAVLTVEQPLQATCVLDPRNMIVLCVDRNTFLCSELTARHSRVLKEQDGKCSFASLVR